MIAFKLMLIMERLALTKEINQQLNERIGQLEIEKAQLKSLLEKEIAINQLKTGLLAKASHDLRSPLTNVQLSASLIEHYYERLDQERVFAHVSRIKDSVSDFILILNSYLLSEEAIKADEDHLYKRPVSSR